MWSSRRSRWISVVLFLALVSTFCTKTMPPLTPSGCNPGNSSKAKPLVCVDDLGNPDPKEQRAWDEDQNHGAVTFKWQAKTKESDLDVKLDDKTCSDTQPVCKPNQGECSVKIKKIDWGSVPPGKNGKKELPCKYKTTLTINGVTHDPDGEMIVNPCCW